MKNMFLFFPTVLVIFSITVKSQTQSQQLPIPSENASVINFTDNYNPVITSLPAHSFIYANNPGNPHAENQLEATLAIQDGIYRMYEAYLGQHPMFCQSVVNDANGNLLFFIVDNNIYNWYGVAMIDV